MSMQNSPERVVPSHLFALRTGHGVIRQGCRIHSAIPGCGIMTTSRLPLAGPTSTKTRILIHFFLPQHVEGGFGQMARRRSNGFGMSLVLAQTPVQLADVAIRTARVVHGHRVGG